MVRIGKRIVREDVLLNILGFVSLYVLLVLFGGMLLTFRNLSTTMGHSTGLSREQCPVW